MVLSKENIGEKVQKIGQLVSTLAKRVRPALSTVGFLSVLAMIFFVGIFGAKS